MNCEDEYKRISALTKLDAAAGLKDLKKEELIYLETNKEKMDKKRADKYSGMVESQVA